MKKYILSIIACFGFVSSALACPKIGPFVDFNCDQKVKIAFTGDSITYGRGDVINGDAGGFVLRLEEKYYMYVDTVNFTNIGVPGFTSTQLLRGFKKHLTKKETGETKRKTRNADMIIIKVGVNDWWTDNRPIDVINNIRKLVKFLKTQLAKNGQPPFIAVSTLIPSKRPSQNAYVKAVNSLLLKYAGTKNLPVYIRTDSFPVTMLDDSTVHPTPKGYKYLANIMNRFIVKKFPNLVKKKKLRLDKDADGVYDIFETAKFGTDPTLKDTDGDGYSDGQELFKLGSDPLDPSSPGY